MAVPGMVTASNTDDHDRSVHRDRAPAAHATTIPFARIFLHSIVVRTERFPAYAPELNPIEYLLGAMKRRYLGNPADLVEIGTARILGGADDG